MREPNRGPLSVQHRIGCFTQRDVGNETSSSLVDPVSQMAGLNT